MKLPDTFETRIYLMFIHFSILMIITKKKGSKFDQTEYDKFLNKIEYNLRELGFGDVTVNSKMKELNKILYDILLKLEIKNNDKIFSLNQNLIKKYFVEFNDTNKTNFSEFEAYFKEFYDYCFELTLENMLKDLTNFKY